VRSPVGERQPNQDARKTQAGFYLASLPVACYLKRSMTLTKSRFFFILTLAFGLMMAAYAQAQGKPLMVIRFNQQRIYYEQQLYVAVSKAIGAKPTVMFDLVSYVPKTGEEKLDAQWQATARHNTQTILKSMMEMGVPSSRITTRAQPIRGGEYDEIHLFVR
jgi:hypothetical protein